VIGAFAGILLLNFLLPLVCLFGVSKETSLLLLYSLPLTGVACVFLLELRGSFAKQVEMTEKVVSGEGFVEKLKAEEMETRKSVEEHERKTINLSSFIGKRVVVRTEANEYLALLSLDLPNAVVLREVSLLGNPESVDNAKIADRMILPKEKIREVKEAKEN